MLRVLEPLANWMLCASSGCVVENGRVMGGECVSDVAFFWPKPDSSESFSSFRRIFKIALSLEKVTPPSLARSLLV